MTQDQFKQLKSGDIVRHKDGRLARFEQRAFFPDTAIVQTETCPQLWTATELVEQDA